jgi:HEAT repeat protein
MKREIFIKSLLSLLMAIDNGAAEFAEPLPVEVEKGIMQAVVGFGGEILDDLHYILNTIDSSSQTDSVHIVDVLGAIGNPSSVPCLINFHRHNASFMSGMAAVQALKKIAVEESYIYLAHLLTQYVSGNDLFNSPSEIPIATEALGEWGDQRAVSILEQAATINNPNRMPEMAVRQLAKYPTAHPFLRDLAESNKSLRTVINDAIQKST